MILQDMIPYSLLGSGLQKIREVSLSALKVGDWRVIYEVNHNEELITVHKVGQLLMELMN